MWASLVDFVGWMFEDERGRPLENAALGWRFCLFVASSVIWVPVALLYFAFWCLGWVLRTFGRAVTALPHVRIVVDKD